MKTVKLTYFKPSGKFYCHGEFQSAHEFDFEIYPYIREWAMGLSTVNKNPLPGLSTKSWDGYILVSGEEVVPALVDVRLNYD